MKRLNPPEKISLSQVPAKLLKAINEPTPTKTAVPPTAISQTPKSAKRPGNANNDVNEPRVNYWGSLLADLKSRVLRFLDLQSLRRLRLTSWDNKQTVEANTKMVVRCRGKYFGKEELEGVLQGLSRNLQIYGFNMAQCEEIDAHSILQVLPANLRLLELGNSRSLSDHCIKNFPQTLESLTLHWNGYWTREGLKLLPKDLKYLTFFANKNISEDDLNAIPKGVRLTFF
eukprot:TRINITY_DN6188_c0_g1_i2.p2 TRINITY_DN6188_c0_g1~~TRINITY_DN6188_c0_g1_i2.p2  ORF type:complete len:229 (-),score=40.85 TRINITY_DN6188_c0_g1_i2:1072-1758(-)